MYTRQPTMSRNPKFLSGTTAAAASVLPASLRKSVRFSAPEGVELSRLTRYLALGAVFGLCAMLHAWSRIDLRETAVALDVAETKLMSANAEQQRLKLEYAALRDPARLGALGDSVSLDSNVPVVVIGATAPAVEVASR